MDTETKPFIQVDDEVREMTDEEYAEWLSRPNINPWGGE